LTPIGRQIGLVSDADYAAFCARREALRDACNLAARTRIGPIKINASDLPAGATIADALRRPELRFSDVARFYPAPVDPAIGVRAHIEISMEGYVKRAELAIAQAAADESRPIPANFSFAGVVQLSLEARERLERVRPRTFGSAGRIPGITPADVAVLRVFVHRQQQLTLA
jgi:tRNA uridine 5-carboxymethylaminomethyl modification enzyme